MKFSTSERENKSFEPIAPGVYDVTCVKATEAGDKSYIALEFDLANGKEKVWDRLYSDNAPKAKFMCQAIGKEWRGELTPQDMVGKTVSVDLVIKENAEGKRFNRILTYKPSTASAQDTAPAKPVNEDEIPF